jgi:hypothetical protein
LDGRRGGKIEERFGLREQRPGRRSHLCRPQPRDRLVEQSEVGLGRGQHLVVVDGADQGLGPSGGGSGGGAGRGGSETRADVRNLAVELGLAEAVLERAPMLLLDRRQRAPPLPRLRHRHQLDRLGALGLVGAADACADEGRRRGGRGDPFEPPVEDA